MKIYAVTCCWREINSEHVECVQHLQRRPEVGYYSIQSGDALISRARAIAATRFLRESDADILVSLDSDILFSSTAVVEIAQQAMDHDIVGGIYLTRGGDPPTPASLLEKDMLVDLTGTTKLVPIKYAATGFLAVARRVFERMARDLPLCNEKDGIPMYPFYTPMVGKDDAGDPVYLSEDWAFCERARALGFGIYANPSVQLIHVGTHHYKMADMGGTDHPNQVPLSMTRTSDTNIVREFPDPIVVS